MIAIRKDDRYCTTKHGLTTHAHKQWEPNRTLNQQQQHQHLIMDSIQSLQNAYMCVCVCVWGGFWNKCHWPDRPLEYAVVKAQNMFSVLEGFLSNASYRHREISNQLTYCDESKMRDINLMSDRAKENP